MKYRDYINYANWLLNDPYVVRAEPGSEYMFERLDVPEDNLIEKHEEVPIPNESFLDEDYNEYEQSYEVSDKVWELV